MLQTVNAVFDKGIFFPEEILELSYGTRYRLTIEPLPSPVDTNVWTLLATAAGSLEAPVDWSTEHDKYLSTDSTE